MDKIKEAKAALNRAINGYVIRFDTYRAVDNRQGKRARGIQRWRVDKAICELMLAMLEEARGCAGHFAANPPGSCVCASCVIRNGIKELGGKE